jgi:hypothetical protein
MSDNNMAKSGSIMMIHKINSGGVICDADLACAIGVLLLERHYGADELARQKPLTAADKGDYWRVEGAWNRDNRLEGRGSFFLTIWKLDGRITDFGCWAAYRPDPAALARIKGSRQSD